MFLLHFLAHAALSAPAIPAQCWAGGCRAAVGTQLSRAQPRTERRRRSTAAAPGRAAASSHLAAGGVERGSPGSASDVGY